MRIALCGGLGNQLFQLSAAIHYDSFHNIEIDTNLFSPNTDAISSLIDLKSLRITSTVRHNSIVEKFANLAIRSSRGIKSWNIRDLHPSSSRFIAKTGLKRFYAHYEYVLARDLGYSNLNIRNHKEAFLIGYFQSSIYAQALKQTNLIHLNDSRKSSRYRILEKEILSAKPIILHIRIGDYSNESKFGLVNRIYLLNALAKLETISNNIWVFSDEIEKAVQLLSYVGSKEIFYVNDEGLTTSEVFELMRFGKGYVISNSTFSWWSAFLRFQESAPVIYPINWFEGLPTPKNIFPIDWIGVDFHNSSGVNSECS